MLYNFLINRIFVYEYYIIFDRRKNLCQKCQVKRPKVLKKQFANQVVHTKNKKIKRYNIQSLFNFQNKTKNY